MNRRATTAPRHLPPGPLPQLSVADPTTFQRSGRQLPLLPPLPPVCIYCGNENVDAGQDAIEVLPLNCSCPNHPQGHPCCLARRLIDEATGSGDQHLTDRRWQQCPDCNQEYGDGFKYFVAFHRRRKLRSNAANHEGLTETIAAAELYCAFAAKHLVSGEWGGSWMVQSATQHFKEALNVALQAESRPITVDGHTRILWGPTGENTRKCAYHCTLFLASHELPVAGALAALETFTQDLTTATLVAVCTFDAMEAAVTAPDRSSALLRAIAKYNAAQELIPKPPPEGPRTLSIPEMKCVLSLHTRLAFAFDKSGQRDRAKMIWDRFYPVNEDNTLNLALQEFNWKEIAGPDFNYPQAAHTLEPWTSEWMQNREEYYAALLPPSN